MKRNILMAIAIGVVMGMTVNAQSLRMPFNTIRPTEVRKVIRPRGFDLQDRNLNDQQREEIRKIRTEHQKELVQTSNLLKEKRARLETLQTADKSDMNEINKVIDEIAALQAQEMKAQATNRQLIRNLLTDEQRINYDMRPDVVRENLRASRNIRVPSDRMREQRLERSERLERLRSPERPENTERFRRSERSGRSEG